MARAMAAVAWAAAGLRRARAAATLRTIPLGGLLLSAAASACSLQEVVLVDPEDVVVAEAHVQVGTVAPGGNRVTVLLHRTLGPGGVSRAVPGARVSVRRSDGLTLELAETDLHECAAITPVNGTGSCFWAAPAAASRLAEGDTLELTVELPGGGGLFSRAVVPGAFAFVGLGDGARCRVPGDTPLELRWTSSGGAWAYINETLISGLTDALRPRGIEVDPADDPLYLLGLSISAVDTTIVLPGEFGVFNRFELDQALARELQKGLPPGTDAEVTVAAADRNYVNWVRGGSFNPSGQVRIPSVQGDGTGVFGATVVRRLHVFADPAGAGYDLPVCPGVS
ncbi:MAG: hypothetical protein ACE5GJ_05310 [Gemmatimonadota bacterium]